MGTSIAGVKIRRVFQGMRDPEAFSLSAEEAASAPFLEFVEQRLRLIPRMWPRVSYCTSVC